ncbi:hypothetical protein ACT7DN_10560 [Bacillus paranthracis]
MGQLLKSGATEVKRFEGPCVIFNSQDEALAGIMLGKVKKRRCSCYSL